LACSDKTILVFDEREDKDKLCYFVLFLFYLLCLLWFVEVLRSWWLCVREKLRFYVSGCLLGGEEWLDDCITLVYFWPLGRLLAASVSR
jgi:hypothetical protein